MGSTCSTSFGLVKPISIVGSMPHWENPQPSHSQEPELTIATSHKITTKTVQRTVPLLHGLKAEITVPLTKNDLPYLWKTWNLIRRNIVDTGTRMFT